MKPWDVTDAMAEEMRKTHCVAWKFKDIIAASFNIVVSDDSPITAEWLVKMGYERSYTFKDSFYHMEARQLRIWFGSKGSVQVAIGETTLPTKTIGQLRALHAGLGIGEVGS